MLINKSKGGRLGNQMFGYAFGWLLARRLGYAFENHSQRKGEKFSLEFFPNVKDLIDGQIVTDPTVEIGDSTDSFEQIANRCMGKRAIVRGHFQRAEFYVPHRDELRTLFYFPQKPDHKRGTIFHFRGADFIKSGKEVPLSFYMRVWNDLGKPNDTVVVTDDINYKVANEFCHQTGALIQSKTLLEDFGTMLAANTFVASRSSLAWWAAFLSDAKVIFPVPKEGDRNKFRNLSNQLWTLVTY